MENSKLFQNFFDNRLRLFFHNLLSKVHYGQIHVTFPNNEKYIYKGIKSGPEADITLNNYKFIKDVMIKGNIGLGESYMNQNYTTNSLVKLIEFAVRNKNHFNNIDRGKLIYRIVQKIYHYNNNNSKKNSKSNIKYHYDLGNNFYQFWLDETMSYSSALYDKNILDLKKAQINKYNRLLDLLRPTDKSKILEIGCGWGSLASFIGKNTNAHITAITISKEQYNHVSKMIFNQGLQEKVKVELKDYRDEYNQYDSIVSVEMFEAVGEKYWKIFFNKINQNLKNQGKAVMQIITIKDELFKNYQQRPDFIQRYIFPGGMLPSKKILRNLINEENLNLQNEFSFANSYAKTLNEWNNRFQKSWPEISKIGFNEYFKRMWEYYFSYCECGFKIGHTDISQFLISK